MAKDPQRRPASVREVADVLAGLDSGMASTLVLSAPRRAATRRRVAAAVVAAVGLLLAGSAAVLAWQVLSPFLRPGKEAEPDTAGAVLPVAVAPDTGRPDTGAVRADTSKVMPAPAGGYVNVLAWTMADGTLRSTQLSEEGALPLRNGDQYRIEATLKSPAYLYLFLIDTEGEAYPLYPWEPGKWGTRPAQEAKQKGLGLPARSLRGYTVNGEGSGMWTVLLLARDTPWAATDDEVKSLFAGLPAQRPGQNVLAAVWFENGRVVKNDDNRRAVSFDESDVKDPVLRMQALLLDKLQPHAAFTSAVSFAKLGK